MGLFNDWAVRSGLEPLVERVPAKEALRTGDTDLVAKRDENGDVRMPSSEMIVDFLLQVSCKMLVECGLGGGRRYGTVREGSVVESTAACEHGRVSECTRGGR